MTNSVTFPPSVGGDGSTVTDDSDPLTGLDNYGWRTRFVPALSQCVAVANWMVTTATTVLGYMNSAATSAANAATSATSAANSATTAAATISGATFTGTSTTSNTIALGSMTWTVIESNRAWGVGSYLTAVKTTDNTKLASGRVTAYSGNTVTMNIDNITGGGTTVTAWTITIGNPPAAAAVTYVDGQTGNVSSLSSAVTHYLTHQ